MGSDTETKDGHRIYWPEKRAVSVERSVKFNFEAEEVVGVLLEGENKQNSNGHLTPLTKPKLHNPTIEDVPVNVPEAPVETEGRGRRIRKESEYVRLLREGAGITGDKSTLPRGIQTGSVIVSETEIEHAMATVVESAKGLMPTYEEARKRPDWPKWDEAIQKELKSLEKSGTWCLVKRPPEVNVVDCRWVL